MIVGTDNKTMPMFTGDPKTRFPHPANSEILSVLEANSSPPSADPVSAELDIDDYELHTHPDLYDYLSPNLSAFFEDCFSAAYGYAILATSEGIIFGVARGNAYVAFRLPSDLQPPTSDLYTDHEEPDDMPWPRFDPCADLDSYRERAYNYAKQLA